MWRSRFGGETTLPSRPWPLWCLTAFVLLGFPALNFIYWPQILRSGVLPSDGDSIGIPMFGSILLTLVVAPFLLGVAWLCLRRYNPDTRLWSWRRDRPYRSIVATVLFGAASALLTVGVLDSLRPPLPWYDYLWPAYFSVWVPWLLGLRAAAIDQLNYEPSYTEG
jgi:hypothetical protein